MSVRDTCHTEMFRLEEDIYLNGTDRGHEKEGKWLYERESAILFG